MTDLEKFLDTYKQFGVILQPKNVIAEDYLRTKQARSLSKKTVIGEVIAVTMFADDHVKIIGDEDASTWVSFTLEGKFINQGVYSD